MKWNETILQQLDDWHPDDGRATLNYQEAGHSVSITADRNDELGTLAWEVSVQRPAAAGGSVRGWGEQCVEHLAALDALKLLEIDQGRDEAMLRSAKPTRRGDTNYYYELMLKGTTEAKLRRFQAKGPQRNQVAFPITHEALARVVEGLM